uniref:Pecanex-like protein n=1 Tax=Echinostoma caproni TaxID=27848 RepID=A0A183B950_9TREM
LLSSSAASNTISSLVSASNPIPERESRTEGLTLTELEESIEIGRKDGDWSHLIGLLSAVFSSYEALSSSFPSELDSTDDSAAARLDPSSSSYSKFGPSQPTGDGMTRAEGDHDQLCSEIPMDEDDVSLCHTDLFNNSRAISR